MAIKSEDPAGSASTEASPAPGTTAVSEVVLSTRLGVSAARVWSIVVEGDRHVAALAGESAQSTMPLAGVGLVSIQAR